MVDRPIGLIFRTNAFDSLLPDPRADLEVVPLRPLPYEKAPDTIIDHRGVDRLLKRK